jgi:hypothetical protein
MAGSKSAAAKPDEDQSTDACNADVKAMVDAMEEDQIDDIVPMTVEMECPECGISEMVDAGGIHYDVV